MDEISEFDRKNIGALVNGYGDWFTAQLVRLINKADMYNRERIRAGFPETLAAYEAWERSDEG